MDRARRLGTNGEKDDHVASLYKVSVFVLGSHRVSVGGRLSSVPMQGGMEQ